MKKIIQLILKTKGLLHKIFYQIRRLKRVKSSEKPKKKIVGRNSHGFPTLFTK